MISSESQENKKIIGQGSKSFALASLFFNAEQMQASHALYRWCRFCDDYIDQAIELGEKKQKLEQLLEWTKLSLQSDDINSLDPCFYHLRWVYQKFQIPEFYIFELLEGMRMDVYFENYESQPQLELYAYRVAGVVGLMMCHIMGLKSEVALKYAAHLGIAMQLTNIARDIYTDKKINRTYLPKDLLKKYNLSAQNLADKNNKPQLKKAVQEFLEIAENHYILARKGYCFLQARPAFTISVAAEIYKQIGRVLMAQNEDIFEQRAIVSLPSKLFCILRASLYFFKSRFTKYSFKTTTGINQIWRPI